MNKNIKLILISIPAFLLILSVIAFILNTRIAEGKPIIEVLAPNIVSQGDSLEIKGKNFGDERGSSKVIVSSIDLLSRYILFWSDNLIKIEIPEKAGSGLVFIETGRGVSEPVVLVSDKNVPYIGTGAYLPGRPFIETVDPPAGGAGTVLTIKGDNFGVNRTNSKLLFSTVLSREIETLEGHQVLENFLEIPDSSVISWANKEIRLYLPEYVSTGDVFIQTESGFSNAVYFEQILNQSGISLQNKKTYMFNQAVSLAAPEIDNQSIANVWLTSPVESIFQRNIINLPDPDVPGMYAYAEKTLYKLKFSSDRNNMQISHNTIIDVFERNYTVLPAEISSEYDRGSPLYIHYTAASEFIPINEERIKAVSRSVTRRKTGTLGKAKAIYDYIGARLTFAEDPEQTSPELVIDTKTGDALSYSLLFTALARSSGIPARPVTGILVDDNKNVKNHWWAEYFIQGFGWFPVDPALADGMEWDTAVENPVEYYWGNIDNQHIAFTRGEMIIPELFPDGIVYSGSDYSYVTHNIETDSEITQLRSTWSDVRITTIY